MENLECLTKEELYTHEGGLLVVHEASVKVGYFFYKILSGSYQSGYDAAQNNCTCQDS